MYQPPSNSQPNWQPQQPPQGWQQQYPPQSQYQPTMPPPQYPQPPYMPPQPQFPMKPQNPKRKLKWWGIAIAAFLFLVIGSAIANGNNDNKSIQTSSQQPTSTTSKPTPTANPNLFTSALIGADITYFQQVYGTPRLTDAGYQFPNHLILQTSTVKGYEGRVVYIYLGADTGDYWTNEQAGEKCGVFMPSDSEHLKDKDHPFLAPAGYLVSATIVYQSKKLAKQLPKSEFKSFTKSEPAGTFAASFSYIGATNDQIQNCAVHTNLELDQA